MLLQEYIMKKKFKLSDEKTFKKFIKILIYQKKNLFNFQKNKKIGQKNSWIWSFH